MFGKTQARTFIIISVFWIILSTDVFGSASAVNDPLFALSWWYKCIRKYTRAGADLHTNTQSPTHTPPASKQTPKKHKACVLQLQADWSDKPKLSALWPASWFTTMYGFYSTHSPLITWKIYQNYTPETACSQPELCNWEKMWISPCGYYLFPSFSD